VYVEFEGIAAKVGLDRFGWRLQAYGRIQIDGQIAKGYAQIVSVFRVKTSVFYQVQAASYDIARGKGRTIILSRTRTTKRMTIITMITRRILIPTRESIK
jgi:hypothetical protein